MTDHPVNTRLERPPEDTSGENISPTFDRQLTTTSTNDIVRTDMKLPSNEEADEALPQHVALVDDRATPAVAALPDRAVTPPVISQRTEALSRVSADPVVAPGGDNVVAAVPGNPTRNVVNDSTLPNNGRPVVADSTVAVVNPVNPVNPLNPISPVSVVDSGALKAITPFPAGVSPELNGTGAVVDATKQLKQGVDPLKGDTTLPFKADTALPFKSGLPLATDTSGILKQPGEPKFGELVGTLANKGIVPLDKPLTALSTDPKFAGGKVTDYAIRVPGKFGMDDTYKALLTSNKGDFEPRPYQRKFGQPNDGDTSERNFFGKFPKDRLLAPIAAIKEAVRALKHYGNDDDGPGERNRKGGKPEGKGVVHNIVADIEHARAAARSRRHGNADDDNGGRRQKDGPQGKGHGGDGKAGGGPGAIFARLKVGGHGDEAGSGAGGGGNSGHHRGAGLKEFQNRLDDADKRGGRSGSDRDDKGFVGVGRRSESSVGRRGNEAGDLRNAFAQRANENHDGKRVNISDIRQNLGSVNRQVSELRAPLDLVAHNISKLPDLRSVLRDGRTAPGEHAAGANRTQPQDAMRSILRANTGMQAEGRSLHGETKIASLTGRGTGADGEVRTRIDARLELIENSRRTLELRADTGARRADGGIVGGERAGRLDAGRLDSVRSGGREDIGVVTTDGRGGRRGEGAGRAGAADGAREGTGAGRQAETRGPEVVGERFGEIPAAVAGIGTTALTEEETRRKNRRLLEEEDGMPFFEEEDRRPTDDEEPNQEFTPQIVVPIVRDIEAEEKEEAVEEALDQEEQRQRQLALLAASGTTDPSQQPQQPTAQGTSSATAVGPLVDPNSVLPDIELVEGTQEVAAMIVGSGAPGVVGADQIIEEEEEGANWDPSSITTTLPALTDLPDEIDAQFPPLSQTSGPIALAEQRIDLPAVDASIALEPQQTIPEQLVAPPSNYHPFDYAPEAAASAPPLTDVSDGTALVAPAEVQAIIEETSRYSELTTALSAAHPVQQEDWDVAGELEVEQRRDFEISKYQDHAAAIQAMRDDELRGYQAREDEQREDKLQDEKEARLRRQKEIEEAERKLILLNAMRKNQQLDGPEMPRVKYAVQPGDTLESIATRRLRDKRLAGLIFELNKDRIPWRLENGKTVLLLAPGADLRMPNHVDIARYYAGKRAVAASFGYDEAGDFSNAPTTQLSDAELIAQNKRRENIEKVLGSLASNAGNDSPSCIVRLGDSLTSLAQRLPVMADANLWKLLAEINNIDTKSDISGKPIARLQRGTRLILPTAEQVSDFKNRGKRSADVTTKVSTTVAPGKSVQSVIPARTQAPLVDPMAQLIAGWSAQQCPPTLKLEAPAERPHEYVFLREDVRLSILFARNSTLEVRFALEVDFNGWTAVRSYEMGLTERWVRYEVDASGNTRSFELDLPDTISRELAHNDLYTDWETYADQFLASIKQIAIRA